MLRPDEICPRCRHHIRCVCSDPSWEKGFVQNAIEKEYDEKQLRKKKPQKASCRCKDPLLCNCRDQYLRPIVSNLYKEVIRAAEQGNEQRQRQDNAAKERESRENNLMVEKVLSKIPELCRTAGFYGQSEAFVMELRDGVDVDGPMCSFRPFNTKLTLKGAGKIVFDKLAEAGLSPVVVWRDKYHNYSIQISWRK